MRQAVWRRRAIQVRPLLSLVLIAAEAKSAVNTHGDESNEPLAGTEPLETSNIAASWERRWDHASTAAKMPTGDDRPRARRVLREEPMGGMPGERVVLHNGLCALLTVPRAEAELWWYAEVGAACNRSEALPSLPPQEPTLWAVAGPAVVTRFGAVLARGTTVVLDPLEHGACHRMRTPDDLSPRALAPGAVPPETSHGAGWVSELFVLSQPWGHTVFHFIAECLPKVRLPAPLPTAQKSLPTQLCIDLHVYTQIAIALEELEQDAQMHVHVPLSAEAPRTAERVMVEEYLALLLPGVVPDRLVSGEVTVTGTTYAVTPTRCAVGQMPLLTRLRRHLHARIPPAVSRDEDLRQELLDTTTACVALHDTAASLVGPSRAGDGKACEDGLVVLVRRSGHTRRFSRSFEEHLLQTVEGGAHTCKLRVAIFDADAGMTPAAVLALFAVARGVIAPHGAGLANVMAARKGTHVLEFHPAQPEHPASGLPGLNLCMLHLARALGLPYTGALMSPLEEAAPDADAGSSEKGGTAWAGDLGVVREWVRDLRLAVCAR